MRTARRRLRAAVRRRRVERDRRRVLRDGHRVGGAHRIAARTRARRVRCAVKIAQNPTLYPNLKVKTVIKNHLHAHLIW